MERLARPLEVHDAFADPEAIRRLVQRSGPYPSIASYLPPAATRRSADIDGSGTTLPWFRGNWVVNGAANVAGADVIIHNERFRTAAAELFGVEEVTPTTVVVNINAPMPAGAVHVDIPSFRGARRDRYPLQLLQAMGTSGLFEPWRVVEAGAVWWSYDGAGGAYDYWPDGLTAAMRSRRPPFDNVAVVADNDRMYHRIGWVGDAAATPPPIPASAVIDHGDDGWVVTDGDVVHVTYPDQQVRISILWKARVDDDRADALPALTPERVVEVFTADLRDRDLDATPPVAPLTDEAWIARLHSIYYPIVTVDD